LRGFIQARPGRVEVEGVGGSSVREVERVEVEGIIREGGHPG